MIAFLYAGLLSLFYIFLSARVIQGRYKHRISLGGGGDKDMECRMRVHGNFAEYTPIGLIVLFGIDYADYADVIVHGFGFMLLAGRILHAWGLSCATKGRQAGMVLTFIMIACCAVLLILDFLFAGI